MPRRSKPQRETEVASPNAVDVLLRSAGLEHLVSFERRCTDLRVLVVRIAADALLPMRVCAAACAASRPKRPFVDAGRRIAQRRTSKAAWSAGPRINRAAVRAWAAGQGLQVSERGRISAEVMGKYEAAHLPPRRQSPQAGAPARSRKS
jgi:hypothetical protein